MTEMSLVETVKNAKKRKKAQGAAKTGGKKKGWKAPEKPIKGVSTRVELKGALNTDVHRNGSQYTEKRPGVCAIIIRMWKEASEKAPVTKAEVVEEILKEFPDRDPVKTKNLVGGAPSWLLTYNGIKVSSKTTLEGKKGYWIAKAETEEVARERLRKDREAKKAASS
jgi:hypothetical protein